MPESRPLKPPKYKRIQRNQIVGRGSAPVHADAVHVCECKPASQGGHSCAEDCLNAAVHVECTTGHCPCGTECCNQRIQKRRNAPTRLMHMGPSGWGLEALAAIPTGSFVIEYAGEVVNIAEAERRAAAYETAGLKHTYIMNLRADEVIDATAKGSEARFINHSCSPNCETQKWQVGSELCVGIFAMRDIPAGQEITYSYNLDWNGGRRVRCCCGAPNCVGFLGGHTRSFQDALWREVAGLSEDGVGGADAEPVADALPDFDSDGDAPPGEQHPPAARLHPPLNGSKGHSSRVMLTAVSVVAAGSPQTAAAHAAVAANAGNIRLGTPCSPAAEDTVQPQSGKSAGQRKRQQQSQPPARQGKRQQQPKASAGSNRQTHTKVSAALAQKVAYCKKMQQRKQAAAAGTDALAMYDSD